MSSRVEVAGLSLSESAGFLAGLEVGTGAGVTLGAAFGLGRGVLAFCGGVTFGVALGVTLVIDGRDTAAGEAEA
jgi:hypothetical protein